MAPCTGSTITPKMIRTGKMNVGDRILLEDIVASSPDFQQEPSQKAQNRPQTEESTVSGQNIQSEVSAEKKADHADDTLVHGPAPVMQQQAQSWQQPQSHSQNWQAQQMQPQAGSGLTAPLTYEQMTPYLDQRAVNTQGNQPFVTIPQTPMTTLEFTETIDMTDVQNYLGFLRTQIGRYMRVEQLMGSNQVESRYGFLVGIGSNFIILQEITSGNIMVVDLVTIRLTYIYYSDPVVPPGVQQ